MEYKSPSYKSGLTAEVMYNLVEDLLIRKYFPGHKNVPIHIEESPPQDKLWDCPDIRGELEEFVMSYLFTNLNASIEGFRELFNNGGEIDRPKTEDYMRKLYNHYGSEDDSTQEMERLFSEITKRGDRYIDEVMRISHLENRNSLIKKNAYDSFSQLCAVVELVKFSGQDLGFIIQL